MPYKLFIHPKAKEELDEIEKKDKTTAKRIKKKIKKLTNYPEKKGKHLKHSHHLSIRIGKYRVIYEVKEEKANVLLVGHREKVYKEFQKIFL